LVRVLDRLRRKVDINIWPVEMARTWSLDVAQSRDRCVPEPRKLRERDETFPVVQEQPEAMPGDVGYFND
jgi:hypothetical protein